MDTSRLERLRAALVAKGISSVTLKDGTAVLVDPAQMTVARFNETAAAIADLLRRGASTEDEILEGIVAAFDVAPEEARREIGELLTTLEEAFGLRRES